MGGVAMQRGAIRTRLTQWLACAVFGAALPAVAQPSQAGPAAPIAGKVLGTVIRTQDADELRFLILRPLVDRYARQRRIEVTAAETDAYVSAVQQALERDRAQQLARRDDLARQLSAPGLTPAQRAALGAQIDAADKTVAALASNPDDAAARRQVAAAFIRQWKVNRSLHRQFGGRIAFQQGGPEPLDAYRRFLEQRQARGDFKIFNADLRAAFWRYYRTDSIHSFYARGSAEESQAFAIPPWQRH